MNARLADGVLLLEHAEVDDEGAAGFEGGGGFGDVVFAAGAHGKSASLHGVPVILPISKNRGTLVFETKPSVLDVVHALSGLLLEGAEVGSVDALSEVRAAGAHASYVEVFVNLQRERREASELVSLELVECSTNLSLRSLHTYHGCVCGVASR